MPRSRAEVEAVVDDLEERLGPQAGFVVFDADASLTTFTKLAEREPVLEGENASAVLVYLLPV